VRADRFAARSVLADLAPPLAPATAHGILTSLSMPARVVVYTTTYCPYCVRAAALLRKKGVPFEEIDVTSDDEKRRWLKETSGRRTVPQIFINDRPIGGYDELAALENSGTLNDLLREEPPC
jgi:glutaredoxin 3